MNTTPLLEASFMVRLRTGDLDVLTSRTAHEHALIYLHGIPGPFAPLPAGQVRVVDQLYDVLADGRDVYYPLYTMPHGRRFDLDRSLEEARATLAFVGERRAYRSVTLVGQSWGGALAAALARDRRFHRVILVSPFVFIPTGAAAVEVTRRFTTWYPDLLQPARTADLRAQLERIARENDPVTGVLSTPSPVSLLAAERDEIIPYARLRDLDGQRPAVNFVSLPGMTHELEDRGLVRELVRRELMR